MSSGIKVVIILPTKHRLAIKIPSKQTVVRQVLEEACLKKSLDPDQHQLRRNNKVSNKRNIRGITIFDYTFLVEKLIESTTLFFRSWIIQ